MLQCIDSTPNRPMKILQINKFFWNKGGSETYYFSLIKLLERAGHTVIPFSMQDERNQPSPFEKYFVPQVDFQSPTGGLKKAVQFLYSKEARVRLEALILKEKPDLAHAHNIAHQLTPAILPILKKHGIPVVQTLHDYQLICPNYKLYTQGSVCERCFKHKYYNAALHKCLKNSAAGGALGAIELTLHRLILRSYDKVDLFICPSQFLYDRLVAWGIPEQKLRYIPNFVELSARQPAGPFASRQGFLFAGRLMKEKGIDLFLAAARALPKIEFDIAGQAETTEETARYAAQAKALPNVRWHGHIQDKAKLNSLMAQVKAVVVPSEWYENAPLTVLEALAANTWVIASNRGGLPELIQSGKNGMVFEPGSLQGLVEAIQQVAAKPGKPETTINGQFLPQAHVSQIQAVYQQLKS